MPISTHEDLKRLGIGQKIQKLRERNGIAIDDLAKNVRITKVLLSQIEGEVVPPTVATLLNIARRLGVGIDYFFTSAGSEPENKIELTRVGERLAVRKDPNAPTERLSYNYESLAYRLTGKKMEPFFVEFDTNAEAKFEPLSHGGEEFLYCLEGQIEFVSENEKISLFPGDSLYYFASVPHLLRGVGDRTPKALVVLLPGDTE